MQNQPYASLTQRIPDTGEPVFFAAAPATQADSRQLLGAARELLIRHRGQCYRLRETRAGKLILTK